MAKEEEHATDIIDALYLDIETDLTAYSSYDESNSIKMRFTNGHSLL